MIFCFWLWRIFRSHDGVNFCWAIVQDSLIFICFWRVFCLRLWFWTLFAFAYAFGCLRALASLTAGLWFRALASGLLTLAFSGLWPLISCSGALAFSCLWPLVSCSGLGPLARALVLWPSLAFGFVLLPLCFCLCPFGGSFDTSMFLTFTKNPSTDLCLKSFGRSPLVKNQPLIWHFQRFAFKIFQKIKNLSGGSFDGTEFWPLTKAIAQIIWLKTRFC